MTKRFLLLALLVAVTVLGCPAQVTPAQPTKFRKRDLGTGAGNGSSVGVRPATPDQAGRVTTIHYIAVAPKREWTNLKGTSIQATILAFEQERPKQPGTPLTIIRDGRIRLLRDGARMPAEVALETLCEADQAFVAQLDAANRKAASAAADAGQPQEEGATE